MSNKFLCIFMPFVLASVLVTGCGSNSEPQVSEAPTESESSLPSGNVNLTVWGAEEDGELINQIISSFKTQYGSQATFNITFEPHSESSCKDDVLGDVLNAPDVFTFADDQLMAMVASGVLKGVENASEISSRNLQAASDSASVGGTLYAYPLTADNGYFLFYNKAYLTDEDVASMDGLLAAANQAGKKIFMEMNSGWYMYSFFGNTDMEIGLKDDGISTFCNWNSKSTSITGLEVAQAMLEIGSNPAFTATYETGFAGGAADDVFIAGVSGIWDENAIKEAWGDNYGACKLPTYTVADEQLQMASYAGYKLVGVNSYSPNAKWASVFADWMTNEQNQTLRFEMRGQGPSNLNSSKAGAVGESKAIQALQQQAEYSSLQRVGGTYWDPAANFGTLMSEGNPSEKDLQVLLNEMVTGITGEEVTGDEVVEAVADESTDEASIESSEETTDAASDEASADSSEEMADESALESSEESSSEASSSSQS